MSNTDAVRRALRASEERGRSERAAWVAALAEAITAVGRPFFAQVAECLDALVAVARQRADAEEPGAQGCLRRLEAARASVGEAEMLAWAEITQK